MLSIFFFMREVLGWVRLFAKIQSVFLRECGTGFKTMRIFMQTPGAHGGRPRFCLLTVQPDLLEGWTLLRENGYQGYAGQVKRVRFSSRELADAALAKMRDDFVRRGYQTMYTEGQAAPGSGVQA